MKYLFQESEIPYETLNQFGLTPEMIDDLPLDVLDDLYVGKRSPVLPVKYVLENGETVKDRVRISLVRLNDGKVDVLFYPTLEKALYNNAELMKDKLTTDKALRGFRNEEEKQQGKEYYAQLDPETKHVLSVPASVLDRNLQMVMNNHRLEQSELNLLKKGEVLTIFTDNAPLSIGIDLNSRTGIRLCDGNAEKWHHETRREWEKYTFGAFGCWVMDDDGNLDYVNEDDYTDEMWNEQKNKGMRQAGQKL